MRFLKSGAVAAYSLGGMTVLAMVVALEKGLPRARLRFAFARLWSKGFLRLLGIRVVVQGRPLAPPTLLVANHVSWLDIILLMSVSSPVFVAKAEMERWPILGPVCRALGTLFVARGEASATQYVASRAAFLLAQRRHVVVFPEGTTSSGEKVKLFYPRLFQPAIHARVPVQPVALTYPGPKEGRNHPLVPFVGDDELVKHIWRLLGAMHLRAVMTFCDPIATAGRPRRDLARKAQEAVMEALAQRQEGSASHTTL